MTALIRLMDPAVEPVTLAEAKSHLRVDSDMTDQDALIQMLISTAREFGEMLTGRSFITQRWRLVLDGFYEQDDCGLIQLERGLVQSVDTITYLDTGNVSRVVDLSTVAKDLASLPARLAPVFGGVWPISQPQLGAVQVDYTAGYGAVETAVPAGIRQWILVRIATLYEHREEVEILPRGKIEPMPFIDGLLDPYKVPML